MDLVTALWLAEFADDDSDLHGWTLNGGAIKRYRAITAVLVDMLVCGRLRKFHEGEISEEGFSQRAKREFDREEARQKHDEHIAYAVGVETEIAKTGRGAQQKIAAGRGKHRSTVHRALQRDEQKKMMLGLLENLKKQRGRW